MTIDKYHEDKWPFPPMKMPSIKASMKFMDDGMIVVVDEWADAVRDLSKAADVPFDENDPYGTLLLLLARAHEAALNPEFSEEAQELCNQVREESGWRPVGDEPRSTASKVHLVLYAKIEDGIVYRIESGYYHPPIRFPHWATHWMPIPTHVQGCDWPVVKLDLSG